MCALPKSRRIALVSCVGQKLDRPAPARDLDTSTWFRKTSKLAELPADAWYSLFAQHGLIRANEFLAPYDLRLGQLSPQKRRAWARDVLGSLLGFLGQRDTALFLALKQHREHLIESLTEAGVEVEISMQGLRIGEQLQWLTERLAEL